MAREKEYLYKIEFPAKTGGTLTAHIDYFPDRPSKPWMVRVNLDEVAPAYATIGAAQAFLRKHYFPKAGCTPHYIQKHILFDRLHVPTADR